MFAGKLGRLARQAEVVVQCGNQVQLFVKAPASSHKRLKTFRQDVWTFGS